MTRPLLVHRVIGRLNVGGPAMHVVNLARGLDRISWDAVAPTGEAVADRPFRTRLIAGSVPPAEGDMAWYAEERGVEVRYVTEMSREVRPADAVALARLVRLFRSERPDIVHTHTAKAGALGRVAAALAGVPVRVHTFHGHVLGGDYFTPRRTAVYREVERQLARLTHRIVVLTEGQRRQLAEEHRVAGPDRFEVVPLGLDLEAFLGLERERTGEATRQDLGLGPDERVVGIVGRLVPIKHHELLLEAAALLAADGVPVRVLVVGGGEREAELRARASALGIAPSVTWLGWRTDLPRLYAVMDVLALPSRDEGTPVAVIEALAAGTPVVARAVGGVPEMLEGGRLGRLVETDRPADLAGALGATLADGGAIPAPERADARARAATRWSVERLSRDMAALYGREARRAGLW